MSPPFPPTRVFGESVEAQVIALTPGNRMATSLVPSDGADCLDRLGKNFQLTAEVVGALSKAGIANLEEFPTEVCPSDAAVSGASREMSKRLLCVTAVWKVKTLQWDGGVRRRAARAPGLGNVPGQALHVAAGLRPGRGESAGQRAPGRTPRSSSPCHWTW